MADGNRVGQGVRTGTRTERKGKNVNCKSLEKWVWQEGAGNLPAAAVEHASGCSDCRALIEQVRLLDRSVGATVTPDPSADYWDAMAIRIARRLNDPTDQVIELVPGVPIWRRFVTRAWAPTMAVALLAVIASQKSAVSPSFEALDEAQLRARVAALSGPKEPSAAGSDQFVDVMRPTGKSGESKQSVGATTPSTAANTSGNRALPQDSYNAHASPSGMAALSAPTVSDPVPAMVDRGQASVETTDQVWPDRQVTIMGAVDSNSPAKPQSDDKRLAAQDPFGAYERQMAEAESGLESAGTFASPGRLLDGPTSAPSRGSERLTPAEQMRRFDEIAELRQLITRLEEVPVTSRAMSQWTQWSTAWYRLGMLSDQGAVIDSAITAVEFFTKTVPVDETTSSEWQVRKSHLENRRSAMEQ